MADLTPKQQRFVEEYLKDLNATQAAIRAGYSERSAYSIGQENLTKPEIRAAVSGAMEQRSIRARITADEVLTEFARVGFADIRKVVKWRANVTAMIEDEDTGEQRLAVINEVQLVNADEIDDDTAAAIREISQSDKGGLKIKLHDKLGALDKLARHLSLYNDKVEVAGLDALADRIEQAAKAAREA